MQKLILIVLLTIFVESNLNSSEKNYFPKTPLKTVGQVLVVSAIGWAGIQWVQEKKQPKKRIVLVEDPTSPLITKLASPATARSPELQRLFSAKEGA